ncbi:hypothetical protein [Nannocystis exedens]|uniref:hypothetical protein n=1 Tax=Nannocystis exedens TaxID=54 RepID=UPI0011607F72|nr:hypothetical protein [Nannocystis exedens]
MKTSPLSLASALLLAAGCFNPAGSDPTTGTSGSDGPTTTGEPVTTLDSEGPATSVEPTSSGSTTGDEGTATAVTGDASTGVTTGEPCTLDVCPCDSQDDCEPGLQCLDGTCVECIDSADCDGQACDPVDHVCRPCREHADCPETACELDDGLCFPRDSTSNVYIDPQLTCADQPCTFDQPCCSISQAMSQHQDATHVVVHLNPGTYATGLHLAQGGRRVALLGNELVKITVEAEPAVHLGVAMQDLAIDSELYVSQIRIEGGQGSAAVRCKSSARLWLDDVEIVAYGGRAISASDCRVVVRRGQLALNLQAITVDEGTDLRLENTLVAHYNMGAALEVGNASAAHLLYTTLGDVTQHAVGLFACLDGTAIVNARNSALLSHGVDDTFACAATALDLADSVVSAATLENPDTNTAFVDPGTVHLLFNNWGGGDLHVAGNGGALAGAARWKQGDPRTDVDGEPRPTMDGAPDVAGGDRPPG